MQNVLSIENVSKKFGRNVALDKINLKVNKGDVIGLIGSNGSGKTTLIEIIAGISKPTSGKVKYNFKYNKTFKEKIGIQFQESSYPSGLTVKDLISFACSLRKIEIKKSELKKLLETFQIGAFYKKKIRSLSSGQKQKVNILLSVIHNPEIVILDELTTGLDISAREEIIAFTKKMIEDRKISALLISHHMDEVKLIANRVVVLSDGKVVKDDRIDNIERNHKTLSDYMVKLISSNNKKVAEKDIDSISILGLTHKGLLSIIKLFKYLGIKKFIRLLKYNWINKRK